MNEQCLELKNVCKSFRDFTLNNISFTLPQGYIMGLVGPNGAGKTTTIQLILNMLEKDAGRILAFGKDNVVSEKEIKQDIGIVFDSIFYVDSWTVKDTEKAVSIFYDNWRHDIFNDMVKRFDLPLNKKVGVIIFSFLYNNRNTNAVIFQNGVHQSKVMVCHSFCSCNVIGGITLFCICIIWYP